MPTTREEFGAALGSLLRSAHENDVDVRTGWTYRHDESYPDWEVQILDLRKPDHPPAPTDE